MKDTSVFCHSGDILGQVIVPPFSFSEILPWFLAVCFGSLSCWNIPLLPSFWRLGVILSDGILVYPQAVMVPSINVISPTLFALMQPVSHSYLRASLSGNAFTLAVLARFTPGMLDPIWAEQIHLGLLWPKNVLPILIRFLFFSKVLSGSVVPKKQAGFFFLDASTEVAVMQRLLHCLNGHRNSGFQWQPLCQVWNTYLSGFQTVRGIISRGWPQQLWLVVLRLALYLLITAATDFQIFLYPFPSLWSLTIRFFNFSANFFLCGAVTQTLT